MLTYDNLVEISRICFKQAREAKNPSVSAELKDSRYEPLQWIVANFPILEKSEKTTRRPELKGTSSNWRPN
jgi:hypothetical protein